MQQFESDQIEFKSVTRDKLPKDLWESISAFSNADGGKILLGVEPSGNRKGINPEHLDKFQNDVVTLAKSSFNATIYPEIFIAKDNVLEIYIPSVPAVLRPIYLKKKGSINGGRIRIGSTNQVLDQEWIKKFAIAAQGGAETLEYDKNYKNVLDETLVNNYVDLINKIRGNVYQNFKIKEVLEKLRAISANEKVTMFGLLAFSKGMGLQEIVSPAINIAVTQYAGDNKVNPLDVLQVSLDDREFNSNVKHQFEEALKFIISKLPVRSSIKAETGKRRSYLVVPEIAIREVLANTIAHRDYSNLGSRIQIDIFSDRIEFSNPGKSLVPLAELELAHPQTRNPLLMNYLKDHKITEQRARGIRTIKESIKEAGLTPPKFENRNDFFVATLFTSAFINDQDKIWLTRFRQLRLSDNQLNALVHIRHNISKGINNSEYRQINNMVKVGDDIRAKKELNKLVQLGLVIKTGKNRYTRYLFSTEISA